MSKNRIIRKESVSAYFYDYFAFLRRVQQLASKIWSDVSKFYFILCLYYSLFILRIDSVKRRFIFPLERRINLSLRVSFYLQVFSIFFKRRWIAEWVEFSSRGNYLTICKMFSFSSIGLCASEIHLRICNIFAEMFRITVDTNFYNYSLRTPDMFFILSLQ